MGRVAMRLSSESCDPKYSSKLMLKLPRSRHGKLFRNFANCGSSVRLFSVSSIVGVPSLCINKRARDTMAIPKEGIPTNTEPTRRGTMDSSMEGGNLSRVFTVSKDSGCSIQEC